MAYIQQRGERKYKITVCNGYTTTGKKRYSGREKLTFKCRAFETKFSRKR